MKRFTQKLISLIPSKRKIVQLYIALMYNANIKGFVTGSIFKGASKQVCVPGLNCYSCPGAIGACPLGSLQGSFSADKSTLYYVGGILLLYCILFGRMVCGWLCPFGLIQELVYKIKTPKLKKSNVTRVLSCFKYVVLVFFVLIVPIMYAFRDTPLPAFCKYICPAGTLEGGISLLANKVNDSYFSMLGPLFTWKFVLMISIIVGCVFIFRMFCRFICPLGALYSLFNRISLFGVKVDNSKCVNCGLCVKKCLSDIKKVGDRECISCGDCVSVCPTKAIVWKGIKKSESLPDAVKGNEKARLITRAAATLILAVVVIFAAVSCISEVGGDTSETVSSDTSDISYGTSVGSKCYGKELQVITSEGISDTTVDPTSTGKITVINFWGTWCTPCVNELPYFDRIASEYGETVEVFAVHTNMIRDTAPEFIEKYYPDSLIRFASDADGEEYYTTLGGRDTYPYTVIINADGVITHVYYSALTYEKLQEAIESIGK